MEIYDSSQRLLFDFGCSLSEAYISLDYLKDIIGSIENIRVDAQISILPEVLERYRVINPSVEKNT